MLSPVGAVAATDAAVVVATAEMVSLHDLEGRRVRSFRSAALTGPGDRRRAWHGLGGSWSALGLPAAADWARRYDLEEVEDADDPRLVDEHAGQPAEATGGGSRTAWTATREPAATPIVLAAGREQAWIGRQDGLWRIDLDAGGHAQGMVRSTLAVTGSVEGLATSADGRTLAAAVANRLQRSTDGGRTFTLGASLSGRRVRMGVTAEGAVLSLDVDSGVVMMLPAAPEAGEVLVLEGGVDLTTCGPRVMVAGADQLFLAGGSGETFSFSRVGAAPVLARRVTCAADGSWWGVASAEALSWRAADGGSWSDPTPLPAGVLTGLAVAGGRVWAGTSQGLWTVTVVGVQPRGGQEASSGLAAISPGAVTRIAPPPRRWWAVFLPSLLPRLDLLLATARVGTRHEVQGLIVLSFSLAGRRPLSSRDAGLLLERARRVMTAAAPLRAASAAADDASAAEEQAALNRVLQEGLQ